MDQLNDFIKEQEKDRFMLWERSETHDHDGSNIIAKVTFRKVW